ncbi:MAG: FtsQ-type POTRA domain-containing protein [Candidatus Aminicenantales bacterium]
MDGERRVAEPVKPKRFLGPDCPRKYRIAARSFAVLFMATALVRGVVDGGHLNYPGSLWLKMPGQVAGLFGLAAIDIELAGLRHHEPRDVLEHIGVRPGEPLIGFDAKKARLSLQNLDWIDSANVVRRFPNQLHITIVEREPFVVWQHNGVLQVVDQNGKPMVGAIQNSGNVLLHVVGEGANLAASTLVNQMESTPGLMLDVKAAVRVGDRRWDLHMKNGVLISLPELDLESILKKAETSYLSENLTGMGVAQLDLRFAGETIYQTAGQIPVADVDPTTTSSIR